MRIRLLISLLPGIILLTGCESVKDFFLNIEIDDETTEGILWIIGASVGFSILGELWGRVGGEITERITIDDKAHYIGTGQYYDGDASTGTSWGNTGLLLPGFLFGYYKIAEYIINNFDNLLFTILGLIGSLVIVFFILRFLLRTLRPVLKWIRYIIYICLVVALCYWLFTIKTH